MKKPSVWLWLFVVIITLTALLVFKLLNVWEFFALSAIWLIGFLLYLVGPETISEITVWKASIKRDVKAAREIREEIEKISNDLKSVIKLSVENAYILGSSSFLAMGGDRKAKERLENNLDLLTKFVESDENKQDLWWKELKENTFPERIKEQSSNEN